MSNSRIIHFPLSAYYVDSFKIPAFSFRIIYNELCEYMVENYSFLL